MKRSLLLFTFFLPVVFVGCYSGATEHKNDTPFRVNDTANEPEHLHSPGTIKDSIVYGRDSALKVK